MGKKPSGKRKRKFKYEKKISVHCSTCPRWINEKEVKFLNIEEDIQGHDVLTFECPKCGTKQKSKRFG